MEKGYIDLQHINKFYGEHRVIDDLSLSVKEGEFLILLGASGCGKSTTLRMIAGLETITSGQLTMNGRLQNDVPPGERNIAMAFQDYALYPHMTVENNITYGLKVNKVSKKEITKRLNDVLTILHLGGLADRYPRQLSGGQRQRVALARAIAKQSPVFLLDEPLSNLDAQMRISARHELLQIHQIYGQTMIYVTHDQIEAMTLGDRIVLIDDGKLQMIDTPYNVYHHPVNVFVARFIGTPSTNILEIDCEEERLLLGTQAVPLDPIWKSLLTERNQSHFFLGIRPEYLTLSKSPSESALPATIVRVEEYGSQYGIIFNFENQQLTAISESRFWTAGEKIYFSFDQQNIYLFDRETEQSIGFPDQVNGDLLYSLD